jgi:hypothetical protein
MKERGGSGHGARTCRKEHEHREKNTLLLQSIYFNNLY